MGRLQAAKSLFDRVSCARDLRDVIRLLLKAAEDWNGFLNGSVGSDTAASGYFSFKSCTVLLVFQPVHPGMSNAVVTHATLLALLWGLYYMHPTCFSLGLQHPTGLLEELNPKPPKARALHDMHMLKYKVPQVCNTYGHEVLQCPPCDLEPSKFTDP